MILVADIGGTKVNLAVFRQANDHLEQVGEARFESQKYSGLEDILDEFCQKEHPQIERAAFGIAGPVKDGKCEVTNLPWVVDVQNLKKQLGLESVWLINDLAAMACAVPFLPDPELEVLQEGREVEGGRVAILAAGTGLGEAFLIPDGTGRYLLIDSEGGHCDFAPRAELEMELLDFLNQKLGRTSIERVLSGPGLHNIYQFLVKCHAFEEPSWLTQEFQNGDPGEVITQNGLQGKSPACAKALEMLVSIYGAVAGDLGLQLLTRGGIYIGGGIAPKILPLIKSGLFMESFYSKGRFKPFMREIPVKVILNEKASLLGLAHYALGAKFVR
ncbi:MAG: glucokinase [Nitrospinae bacterium]|jgi:glucokinase|nr:glucokinase [Nitrospinota bacterium]MDA1110712.1 glucokinase [Nitrospinota bacterium]